MELSLIEPLTPATSTGTEALASAESMVQASLVRVIDTSQFSPPSPDPSGIAYLPDTGTLLISDAEVNEMSIFTGVNLFEMTLTGDLLDTFTTTSFSDEPNGADYDPDHRRFFFSDDTGTRSIYEVNFGPDGLFGTSDDIVTSFGTGAFGSSDPEGVAYDSWQGNLFIADGLNNEIYKVSPGANGVFDGVPPGGDDVVTSFDTEVLGLLDPEGISFNTDNGYLHMIGEPTNLLFEVSTTGTLLRIIDVSVTNARKPAGLAYAPSSINPSEMNIYIVARGVDNDSDPNENDGMVYEISFPQTSSGNTPPTVDAGPDQVVTVPDSAMLDGTVDDDGLPDPPGVVSVTWSLVSGPGTVDFADVNAVDTTASFSIAGIYVLRLTANDGEFQSSDDVTVVMTGDTGTGVVDVRVAASSDDAEEKITGGMRMTSSDLELVYDSGEQTVGMRFNGVDIPLGASIANAYVQFQTDEADSDPTSLTIKGEAADNAVTFAATTNNISSRPTTASYVSWSPDPWLIVGEAGSAQRTPDISSIIQEIVNRPGWTNGNSLVIIITGTGVRTAEAYEGVAAAAPLLHVEYGTGPPNNPPVANDDTAITTENTPVTINVSANDVDPDDNLDPTTANTDCSLCSVPSNGTLINNGDGSFDYTPDPDFNGNDEFIYEICDTVSACDTANVTVTVDAVNDAPQFTSTPITTATEGALYTYGITASDPDAGDILTITADTLPAWLNLVDNGAGTATLSGTPASTDVGDHPVVLRVTDAGGLFATQSFTVTVTTTVSFQDGVDGYTGTRDTKLMSQEPTMNFGDAIRLELDGSPLISSLLYWDLSSIQPGSIIHSVDVTVNITNASGHFYEFYELLRPWVENQATWNEYASGQGWQAAGADGSSDRGSTVLGSITGSKGLATVSLNAPGVAMVQAWVNNPSSNHGFIILNYISAKNGLDFSSRETGTVSERPKLTVTYSAGSP